MTLFNPSPGLKKYLSNTTWMLGARIVRMIGAFCVGIYVIRYLGPNNLGMITYAGMLVGLFMIFGQLGLNEILARELVANSRLKDFLLGTTFVLRLLGLIAIWILISIFLLFTDNDPVITYLIIIFAVSRIFTLASGIDQYFDSIVKSKFPVIVGMMAMGVVLVTRLILIEQEASVIAFALAYTLEGAIAVMGLIYIYHRTGQNIRTWKWNYSIAKRLLRDSWPFILSGLAVIVYMRIDQIMIKEMLGIYDVGIYAVAVTLSEAWYFVPQLIVGSLFPAIVNAKKTSSIIYNQRLSNLYQMMFWMAIVVAIVTTFTASYIVPLLYGDAFTGSTNSLCIHIWAGIFVAVGAVNKSHLVTENLQKLLTISFCIGAVLNVILNYFFIALYGIEGAAISTVISYAYASFFGLLIMPQSRHVCMVMIKSLFRTAIPKIA